MIWISDRKLKKKLFLIATHQLGDSGQLLFGFGGLLLGGLGLLFVHGFQNVSFSQSRWGTRQNPNRRHGQVSMSPCQAYTRSGKCYRRAVAPRRGTAKTKRAKPAKAKPAKATCYDPIMNEDESEADLFLELDDREGNRHRASVVPREIGIGWLAVCAALLARACV